MSIFIGTRLATMGQGPASEGFRQTGHHTYATSGDGTGYRLAYDTRVRFITAGVAQIVTLSAALPAYVWDTDFATSDSAAKKNFDVKSAKYVVFSRLAGGQIYVAPDADIPAIGDANDIVVTDLLHHFDGWHQYKPHVKKLLPADLVFIQGGAGVDDANDQFNSAIADMYASIGTLLGLGGVRYYFGIPDRPANYGLAALSPHRVACDYAGNVMLINPQGLLFYGLVNADPSTYTNITDRPSTSSGTSVTGTVVKRTACGIACDGTTWWLLLVQAAGAVLLGADTPTAWRMDVYSSTDAIAWSVVRTISSGWPTFRTAVGIGEAGQVLVIDSMPLAPRELFNADENAHDPLQYSVGVGSSALVPIVTPPGDVPFSNTTHMPGYNLYLTLSDPFGQHTYNYRPDLPVTLFGNIRFCSGPNGPIWLGGVNMPEEAALVPIGSLDPQFQTQGLIELNGSWEDRHLAIAMDDGAGGLFGVDETTGDFLQRVSGSWVVRHAAVRPAREECVYLAFSRKQVGKIVLVHGLGGVARATFIDPTDWSVVDGDPFGIYLTDTAYGFGGTSGSAVFTTYTGTAEPTIVAPSPPLYGP